LFVLCNGIAVKAVEVEVAIGRHALRRPPYKKPQPSSRHVVVDHFQLDVAETLALFAQYGVKHKPLVKWVLRVVQHIECRAPPAGRAGERRALSLISRAAGDGPLSRGTKLLPVFSLMRRRATL